MVEPKSLTVWKWPLERKFWEKKLYHANQRQKYYKLCFDNFSLWRLFFDRALDLVNKSAVSAASITLSDAPRAQDNLSKLLTALSTIAALRAGTLTKNVHKFWRVPSLGAAMAESVVILSMGSVAKIELDCNQERGQKKVVIEKSCQNKVCSIFDAD